MKWHLRQLDGTLMAACPPGFTDIFVHLYKGPSYVEPPDALVRTPCTPEGSLTQPVATEGRLLDPNTSGENKAYFDYGLRKDIYLDVTEPTDTSYAAVSSRYVVLELNAATTIDFDVYPAGGVAVVGWSFQSSLTSAALPSCDSEGVDEVELAARLYGDTSAPLVVIGTWPCTQIDPYFYLDPDANGFPLIDSSNNWLGSGHSSPLAPGDYFIEKRAKRAGAIVGTTETSVAIEDKNVAHTVRGGSITITDR